MQYMVPPMAPCSIRMVPGAKVRLVPRATSVESPLAVTCSKNGTFPRFVRNDENIRTPSPRTLAQFIGGRAYSGVTSGEQKRYKAKKVKKEFCQTTNRTITIRGFLE